MFAQSHFSRWSLPCLFAGLFWLTSTDLPFLLSGLLTGGVGVGLVGVGVSQLGWPGDRRINQLGAVFGVVGFLLSIPMLFTRGLGEGLLLGGSALFAAWGAGRMALHLEPHCPGVPAPKPTVALAAKVAVDDLILGLEQFQSTGFPLDGTIERVVDEIDRCHSWFAEKDFLAKPESYHVMPPDLVDPEIQRKEIVGLPVEVLRFESGYSPAEGEPGRERWLGYDACRDGYAYVVRHEGPPRPWLIATNGYRMGHAHIDLSLFGRFYRECGLNVLIPVLPLHGPRRISWHSGQGFLGIDAIDTLHAEAQAMWDMRRLLSWVNGQDAPAVGALGLSLGGYTTALFASLVEGLSCVVPGIPVSDVAGILDRHGEPHQMQYAASLGYDLDQIREVMRVVSPLALSPKVPHEHRMIFAATADRLVPPAEVQKLWRHWDEPEIVWYNGTHISFRNEREVWAGVDRTLRESGLSAP